MFIIKLKLPQEYLNSHNCSFDINIVVFRFQIRPPGTHVFAIT